jgi:glycerol kinase
VEALERCVSFGQNVSIDGGLARSPYFCRFLASALDRRVSVPPLDELTAKGIAAMAACALGVDLPEIGNAVSIVHEPVFNDVAEWRGRFDAAIRLTRNWRNS